MIVKSLKLKNFRNYELLNIDFNSNTNILYGDNAQGKTNILEALYLCGTTKSHRRAKDRDLIQFDHDEAHLEIIVEKDKVDFQIDVHLKKSSPKGIAVNKIPLKKAGELFGIVHFVLFSPEDLNIIKEGPAGRRRFLDLELSQLDKVYFRNLSNYNRIVNQRNALLKNIYLQDNLLDTLDIWDMQLIDYGNKIRSARKNFIKEINKIVSKVHFQLTGGTEEVSIYYESGMKDIPLEQALKQSRERDLKLKNTTVGPHRDDLCFKVKELDLRRFGSQGQQRTAALSLKLSEIEFVKQRIDDKPILLLDDVLSELDKNRQNYLLDSIHGIQTIVTCTGLDEFINHRFAVNQVFHVKEGTVTKEN